MHDATLITPAIAVKLDTVDFIVPGKERSDNVIRIFVNVCDSSFETFASDYLANSSLRNAFPGGGMGPFLFKSTLSPNDHLRMVNMIAQHAGMPMDDVMVYDHQTDRYTYLKWQGKYYSPFYKRRFPRYLWPKHQLPEGTREADRTR